MKLRTSKGNMFKSVTHTATYYQGCDHDCEYCWAMCMGISHKPKLVQKDEFEVLTVRYAVIFLNSAHDSFAKCIPLEWILSMTNWIGRQHISNKFLLQTKNPERILAFLPELEAIKNRVRIGVTVETNREDLISKFSRAPPVHERVRAMEYLKFRGFETFASIEPFMVSDPVILADLIDSFSPKIVEIGLDNWEHKHGHKLPLSSREEYEILKNLLIMNGVEVLEKDSLKRLR